MTHHPDPAEPRRLVAAFRGDRTSTRVVVGPAGTRALLVDGPAHGTVYVTSAETWHLIVSPRDPHAWWRDIDEPDDSPRNRAVYHHDPALDAQPAGVVRVFRYVGRA